MNTICEDMLLDTLAFLTRKELARLDECCARLHRLVSHGEHLPRALHIINEKLVVNVWPPAPTECAGLFRLTTFLYHDDWGDTQQENRDEILLQPIHADEVPPQFVRFGMIDIMDMADPRIMRFLQNAQHIFQNGDCMVSIIKTPLEASHLHWAQFFDWIHPINELFISFKIPSCDRNRVILEKRNTALQVMCICLRRAHLFTMAEYVQICRMILSDCMDAIWASTNVGGSISHVEHFVAIGKSLSKWLHCRCGKEGNAAKRVNLSDDGTHLVASMCKQILTEMHQHILTDKLPLKRPFSVHINCAFLRDLTEWCSSNFENVGNGRRQFCVDNPHIGETMRVEEEERLYDLCGELAIRRRPTTSQNQL